jgi:hypothetical protein
MLMSLFTGDDVVMTDIDFAQLLSEAFARHENYSSEDLDSSLTSTPELSPVTTPLTALPEFDWDLSDLSDLSDADNEGPVKKATISTKKKCRRGRNQSEGARKRQNRGSHIRRARQRGKGRDEEKKKSTNQSKPHMEKFLKNAQPVHAEYDASNYPACSTGYVGLRGKNHKKIMKLEDVYGPESKQSYRLVQWQGKLVTRFSLVETIIDSFKDRSPLQIKKSAYSL